MRLRLYFPNTPQRLVCNATLFNGGLLSAVSQSALSKRNRIRKHILQVVSKTSGVSSAFFFCLKCRGQCARSTRCGFPACRRSSWYLSQLLILLAFQWKNVPLFTVSIFEVNNRCQRAASTTGAVRHSQTARLKPRAIVRSQ